MSAADIAPAPWLIAYRVDPHAQDLQLVAAPRRRRWMDKIVHPNHCPPLRLANEAGWFLLNDHQIDVLWTGGEDCQSLTVQHVDGGAKHFAYSHFGYGLLTFQLPYLFRTPPGYNLLVRGPANCPKDGAFALDGLVETDWSPARFFMTWQITRANQVVRFDAGEPICMIVPQWRGDLERFAPEVRDLTTDSALQADHERWACAREKRVIEVQTSRAGAPRNWLQRDYDRGWFPGGPVATEHQTRLHLQPFRDAGVAAVEALDDSCSD